MQIVIVFKKPVVPRGSACCGSRRPGFVHAESGEVNRLAAFFTGFILGAITAAVAYMVVYVLKHDLEERRIRHEL